MSLGGDAWSEPYRLDRAGLEHDAEVIRGLHHRREVEDFVISLTENPRPVGSLFNEGITPPVMSFIVPGTDVHVA